MGKRADAWEMKINGERVIVLSVPQLAASGLPRGALTKTEQQIAERGRESARAHLRQGRCRIARRARGADAEARLSDLVRVVEAAYALDAPTTAEWLTRLGDAARIELGFEDGIV